MFCTIGSHDTKCPVYGGAVSLWELDARISSHLSYTNDKLSKCEEKGSWDWGEGLLGRLRIIFRGLM